MHPALQQMETYLDDVSFWVEGRVPIELHDHMFDEG